MRYFSPQKCMNPMTFTRVSATHPMTSAQPTRDERRTRVVADTQARARRRLR